MRVGAPQKRLSSQQPNAFGARKHGSHVKTVQLKAALPRLRKTAQASSRPIIVKAAAAADVETVRPPLLPEDRGEAADLAAEEELGVEGVQTRDHDEATTSGYGGQRAEHSAQSGRRHEKGAQRKHQFVWPGADGAHRQGRKRGAVKDFPFRVGDTVVGKVVGGWNGWRVALEWDPDVLGFVLPIDLPHVLREDVSEPEWGKTKYGLVREFTIKNIPDEMQYNAMGPLLSARTRDLDVIWERARQIRSVCQEDGESLEVLLRSTNRGGMLGSFEGLAVFVPFSFIPNLGNDRSNGREAQARKLVGDRALVSICDMDRKRNRFVGNMIKGMADKAFLSLRVGDLVWGTVHDLERYGAFITLDDHPSIRGLLHVGSISRRRVEDVAGLFHQGERVRCIIAGIDAANYRLNLSTAEIEPEDGDMLFSKATVYKHAEENSRDFRQWVQQRQEEIQDEGQTAEEPLDWSA